MKPSVMSFDRYSDDVSSYESYVSKNMHESISKRKALLNLADYVIRNELTDKQRKCLCLVKLKGLSSVEVANVLGVAPSTVCRHLQAAQKIVDKAFEHFCCIEKFADWS